MKWLRWLVRFGGWEAHHPKHTVPLHGGRWSLRQRLRYKMLTPIWMFGYRVTLYGWGQQLKVNGGYLVRSRSGIFLSPDGTPSSATRWFKGGERYRPKVTAHIRSPETDRSVSDD